MTASKKEVHLLCIHSSHRPTSFVVDGRPVELTLLERPADDVSIHVLVVCYTDDLHESRHALHDLILEQIGLRGRLPMFFCQTMSDLDPPLPVDVMQIRELSCFGWEYISHVRGASPYDREPLDRRSRSANQASCSALTQKGLKWVFDEAIRLALRPVDQRDKKRCCVQ
jgi:hypothetical protein